LLQNPKRSLRWESAEVALNLSGRCAVPNGAYYHLIYALATENRSDTLPAAVRPLLHKPFNVRNRGLRCVPSGGLWPLPLGPPGVVPLAA